MGKLIDLTGQKFGKLTEHFQETGWNRLQYTKKHYDYKNQWCKMNNIPLIRIPYSHLQNLCLQDLLLETSNFIV